MAIDTNGKKKKKKLYMSKLIYFKNIFERYHSQLMTLRLAQLEDPCGSFPTQNIL